MTPAKQNAARAGKAAVSLVRTNDRGTGVPRAIDLLGSDPAQGKDVLLKQPPFALPDDRG